MAALVTRTFGKTGRKVTAVGLGGEGVLRTYNREKEAGAVIREALSAGITYFDSAAAYAGSEDYYGAFWSHHPGMRPVILQTSKSANRDKAAAELGLQQTLTRMNLEYLDLWQIHDLRTFHELRELEGSDGALGAFVEARDAGLVRHIGVTGHHDPAVLTYAVENWPVDAVMLPVNPVEGALGGFLDATLPAARDRGVAVVGMKVLGASHYISPEGGIPAEILIRYALSQDIAVAIVGCSSPEEVRTLAEVGRSGEVLSEDEQQALVDAFRPYARELAYYRGTL
ncbi:aldo/keto reductase [Methanoculleus sp. FWC-SCC1]|uniref:Aldo/keto reductase n=1 Tax=Methanoculleus frigidifontis TaxID=2584085 RepID=A0ABT8ME09_9EURY|nr:aldo/keto reductase [Methanoculleus sp. FWC-SCC1]MDN7026183.1 aldo/keto reductase [Methanoculleus sp. FWC-SCC1]